MQKQHTSASIEISNRRNLKAVQVTTPIRTVCCLALCIGFLTSIRAMATDAAITLVSTDIRGAKSYGSGFISSDQGDVITCYHVVVDSVRIVIYYRHSVYDADVTEIAPTRDIAKLKMHDVPLPTSFFRVQYSVPAHLKNVKLTVDGYAAGLHDVELVARAVKDTPVMSETLSGEKAERLFATERVSLLILDVTVHKGLSGAPVLTADHRVIGVISGSLVEGGSVSWAIAIENSQSQFTTKISEPVSKFVWPKFSFMAGGWEYLRSQTGISNELIDSLRKASAAIDSDRAALHDVCDEAKGMSAEVNAILKAVDEHRELSSERYSLADPSSRSYILSLFIAAHVTPLTRMMVVSPEDIYKYVEIQADAFSKFNEVEDTVVAFEKTLPTTKKNGQIFSEIESQRALLKSRQMELAKLIRIPKQVMGETLWVPEKDPTFDELHGFYHLFRNKTNAMELSFCTLIPQASSMLSVSATDYRMLLDADVIRP